MLKIDYVNLFNHELVSQTVTAGTRMCDAVEKIIPLEEFPHQRVYKYATLRDARSCRDRLTRSCTLVVVSRTMHGTVYIEPRKKTITVDIFPDTRVSDFCKEVSSKYLKKGECFCPIYDPSKQTYNSPLNIDLHVDHLPHADFRVCLKPIAVSGLCDVLQRWPYKVSSIENVSDSMYLVKTDPEAGIRDYLVCHGFRAPVISRTPASCEE